MPTPTISIETSIVGDYQAIKYTFKTTDIPDYSNIFWTEIGTAKDGSFFYGGSTGSTYIYNNTAILTRVLLENFITNARTATTKLDIVVYPYRSNSILLTAKSDELQVINRSALLGSDIDYTTWGEALYDENTANIISSSNTQIIYEWTCPPGVTSVSVVCIGSGGSTGFWQSKLGGGGGGLGWKNNISVKPGEKYKVVVGRASMTIYTSYPEIYGRSGIPGGNTSYFIDTNTVAGFGGESAKYADQNIENVEVNGKTYQYMSGGKGGGFFGDGGGRGGDGGSVPSGSLSYTESSYENGYGNFTMAKNGSAGGGGCGWYDGPGGDGGYADGIAYAVWDVYNATTNKFVYTSSISGIQKSSISTLFGTDVRISSGNREGYFQTVATMGGYGTTPYGGRLIYGYNLYATITSQQVGRTINIVRAGNYGGGAGYGTQDILVEVGASKNFSGGGCVRIIWPGDVRKFPYTFAGETPKVKVDVTPSSSVSETGSNKYLLFIITTINLTDSTRLFWRTTGGDTDQKDFKENINSGEVSVMSNKAYVNLTLVEDNKFEGTEKILFEVMYDGILGKPVASVEIPVNDTSKPAPEITIAPDKKSINETDNNKVKYTVSTKNIADGSILNWYIRGSIKSNDLIGGQISGTVTINVPPRSDTGSGTILLELKPDLTTEGVENIILELRYGALVINADPVLVADTSITPPISYNISVDNGATSVDEDGVVKYIVSTVSIPNGTTLYWTNKGTTSAADFSDNVNSGFFTISVPPESYNGTATIERKLSKDFLYFEGDETIILELRSSGGPTGKLESTAGVVLVKDVVPQITIEPDKKIINETDDNQVTYKLTATNASTDLNLTWYNIGKIKASDFIDGKNTGEVTIKGGTNAPPSFITLKLKPDLSTEGDEDIILELRYTNELGKVVKTADAVIVRDTSIRPAPVYSVTVDKNLSSVDEGGSVTYNITATNVDDGAKLFWVNSGTSSADDFTGNENSGEIIFKVPQGSDTGTANKTLVIVKDQRTDSGENIIFELRSGSTTGKLEAKAPEVKINDTSKDPPSYTISVNNQEIFEGDSINFTVTAKNAPIGTQLYVTLNGVLGQDFSQGGNIIGPITTDSDPYSYTFTKTTVIDSIYGVDKKFKAELTTGIQASKVEASTPDITIKNKTPPPPPTFILNEYPLTAVFNDSNTVTANLNNVGNYKITWDLGATLVNTLSDNNKCVIGIKWSSLVGGPKSGTLTFPIIATWTDNGGGRATTNLVLTYTTPPTFKFKIQNAEKNVTLTSPSNPKPRKNAESSWSISLSGANGPGLVTVSVGSVSPTGWLAYIGTGAPSVQTKSIQMKASGSTDPGLASTTVSLIVKPGSTGAGSGTFTISGGLSNYTVSWSITAV